MAGSVVQAKWFVGVASGAILTLPVATTAGNAILIIVYDGINSGLTLGVSDAGGNTYNSVDLLNDTTNGNTIESFLAVNTASTSSVKATTNSGGNLRVMAAEIGGVTANPLDGHNVNHQIAPGTGTDAITSGSATNSRTAFAFSLGTGQPYDPVSSTPAAGTGFTSAASTNVTVTGLPGASNDEARIEWKTSLAAATHNPAATFTDASGGGSNNYATFVVLLDESGGAAATFVPERWDQLGALGAQVAQ